MIYERRPPAQGLENIINSYWLIDSQGDASKTQQKIVPDGYPEIIIHYGEPYRINLEGSWIEQKKQLLAGQLKKHFFLENSGISGMLGIKMQPTALTHLFGIDMAPITGQVIALPEQLTELLSGLNFETGEKINPEALFADLDSRFTQLLIKQPYKTQAVDEAVNLIISQKGNTNITDLTAATGASERQLERHFKRYVGLSPKFYSRIIRLGYIFELMQEGDKSWSDLVYDSGFYDQSHFIKNFKEFTGEDPSSYGFDIDNMANFHFRKRN